jgi:hypothetical protein
MVQLYPASTSLNISSATSLNTVVLSASGPNTLSKGYVLVVGACDDPPYEEAVVNVDEEDEASGVVSIVIFFDTAPSVEAINGDILASSCGDRPLSISYLLRIFLSHIPQSDDYLNIDLPISVCMSSRLSDSLSTLLRTTCSTP